MFLIPVLHDDDGVVAVAKPAGLPVVPAAGGSRSDCVRGQLEHELGVRLWVVHRLDRDTSGVLLFARTPEVHRALCLAFEERRVRKSYVAFTHGVPAPREGRIATPLHPARRGKVRPARPAEDGAWQAVTGYRVRRQWTRGADGVALVEVHPETGRHHQIRAHLRSVETPILGDGLYGRAGDRGALGGAPLSRLALHASRLVVPAAIAGAPAGAFEAPLPADLTSLLHWLDAGWTVVTGD